MNVSWTLWTKVAVVGLSVVLSIGAGRCVAADQYPSRPVHILVPAAAGGPVDVIVRRVADKLTRSLGQPVVVENRPGAGGGIGTGAAARARPDGYTVLAGSINGLCLTPLLYRNVTYSPTRDFAPVIAGSSGNPILVVNPQLPVKTLAEFVAYARANPGRVSYGSPGVGSLQHLAVVQLERLAGIRMMHVPYKDSSAMALTDVMAGHIQAAVEFAASAVPHIKSGNLRAIVIVGGKRKPVLPDTPTSAEAGMPGFDVTGWHGYLVPAGTPPEIVRRLNTEIAAALGSQDIVDWMAGMGAEIVGGTPQQFGSHVGAELDRWGEVIKGAGIALE